MHPYLPIVQNTRISTRNATSSAETSEAGHRTLNNFEDREKGSKHFGEIVK